MPNLSNKRSNHKKKSKLSKTLSKHSTKPGESFLGEEEV